MKDRPLLAPCELLTLALAAEGLRQDTIASYRGVSYGTVHNTLRHVREKLSATSTCEAVALAFKAGLLPVELDR